MLLSASNIHKTYNHSTNSLHVLRGVELSVEEGEVVGIANNGGHWAPGMPVARGKGVFFEALMPLNLKALDPVSLTMDCDARVMVYKA